MFITASTFYCGTPDEPVVIEAGEEVTAKQLGVSAKKCAEYVERGLLIKKPKQAAEAPADADDDKGGNAGDDGKQ